MYVLVTQYQWDVSGLKCVAENFINVHYCSEFK